MLHVQISRHTAVVGLQTTFIPVLPPALQAGAPLDPEKELQRQLARKLGLKKGKAQLGGEDGLDEFLEGQSQ